MDQIEYKLNKCRACLLENNAELLCWTESFLTGRHEKVTYLECFQACTRIEAYVDDQLPQMLCFKCAAELRDAYEFIKKANQSHQTLLMKQELLLVKSDAGNQMKATGFEWLPLQETDEDLKINVSTNKTPAPEISSEAVQLTIDVDANIVNDYDSTSSHNFDSNPIQPITGDKNLNNQSKIESSGHVKSVKKKLRKQSQSNKKASKKLESSATSTEENNSDSSYIPEKDLKQRLKYLPKDLNKEPETKLLLCHICPRTFKSVKNFKDHALTHVENRKRDYTCENCGKAFYTRSGCRKHYKSHDSNKTYKCTECDKTFRHDGTLKTHMMTHTGGTLECKICGKVLLTKYSYRNHAKTHDLNRKAFQCTQCNRTFLDKKCLHLHMKIHTDGLFKCQQCDKPFLYKESLDNHMLRHLGLTIACKICGKGFPTNGELKSHMLTHSDEKPFKCQYCDRAFLRNTVRNQHELQHEGFRYKCKICDKEYINQPSFSRHKLTHMGITMKCTMCGKGFNDKFKMKRHIAGVHKIELEKTEDLIQKVKTRYEFRGHIIDTT